MDIGIDFFSYSNSSDSNYTQILINETFISGAECITISVHKWHKNPVNSSQRTAPCHKTWPVLGIQLKPQSQRGQFVSARSQVMLVRVINPGILSSGNTGDNTDMAQWCRSIDDQAFILEK